MLESIVTSRQIQILSIDPAAEGYQRLRPGWFARSDATEEERRAATAGGRISCISLLAESGVFRPPDKRLHLAIAPSGRARIGAMGDEIVAHWSQRVTEPTRSLVRVGPREALGHALLCQPADMAVAVVDSALHNHLLTRAAVDAVFVTMPRRIQRLRACIDRRSESGIESLTRFRLALAGIECTPQVVIDRVGRVDLLIDGWLIIELDGRESHDSDDAFAVDRVRDVESTVDGYAVLRFRYAQVVYDWAYVEAKIRARLSRGATR